LKISGESTELDKTVIERISDSLLHLVRNCIDHGIEKPQDRIAANKPETGVIRLNAYQEGGNVVIEIEDDGQGLNHEKIAKKAVEKGLVEPGVELTPDQISQMIFLPGFSTADSVTDVSGRGVGTDAVRTNIRALRGNVEVFSTPGQGTRFILRLPLTLAIMDGLSVIVGDQTYILPMLNIIESVHLSEADVTRPAGGSEKFNLRDQILPLTRLYELFHMQSKSTDLSQGIVVIVEADGKRAGIFVDELLGQQQVVVKSLEEHHRKVEGVATATILGDGEVALILDVTTLVKLAYTHVSRHSYAARAAG
ncbi:MAG: chemotaxis protein CheA, partial [Gammaproteobacteria bacterium]|nr:chemotaxis protein CheA [Gammaproteobacteria bacterium]